jgi:hypothetical protein
MNKSVLVKVVAADAGENRVSYFLCYWLFMDMYGLLSPHCLSSSTSVYSVRCLYEGMKYF